MINGGDSISIIILDIGNVLVSVDMGAIHDAAVDCGFVNSTHEGKTFMKGIENICNFGMMDMSSAIDMFWGYKRELTMGAEKYDKVKQHLIDFWCSSRCVSLNKNIVEFCNKILHMPDTYMMLASNMGVDHYNYINSLHPFFTDKKLFSVHSFKVGAVKPQDVFFSYVEKKIDKIWVEACCVNDIVTKQNVLYVDDRIENLLAGEKCVSGINAYKFDSTKMREEDFIHQIKSFQISNRINKCQS